MAPSGAALPLALQTHDGDGPATRDNVTPEARPGGLEIAEHALDARAEQVGATLPDRLGPLVEQQHLNVETAQALVAISEAGHASDLAEAVALAKEVTRWQAATLGFEDGEPVPLEGYERPSPALLELARRHDVTLSADQLDALGALDEQPQPLRGALARFVDAFLALDTARQIAYGDADVGALAEAVHRASPTSGPVDLAPSPALPASSAWRAPAPGQPLRDAGADLGPLFATRPVFLDALLDLHAALQAGGPPIDECGAVQAPPAFSVDLAACDSTYTQDVALMVDGGGDDVYHNNAGGSNLAGGQICSPLVPGSSAAATLADFGAGDDRYGNPLNPRICGSNGSGGAGGVGSLYDGGGRDDYNAEFDGANGGASGGLGLLIDEDGDDRYNGTGSGLNGGGALGAGLLIDQAGNDTYNSTGGANGGAFVGGTGTLIDQGSGEDFYNATDTNGGSNGGGVSGGRGFLIDEGGDDVYDSEHVQILPATEGGTNGGGSTGGVGFLLNRAGDDEYNDTHLGANGGANFGAGSLIDEAGNDLYNASDSGTNGGSTFGSGLLVDRAGDDTYRATDAGVNGGANFGTGLLDDRGGTDTYSDDDTDCRDCTLAPKGIVGVQRDSDDPIA